MSDLLTPSDRAEIRAALRDVSDTFNKTTITYKKWVGRATRFSSGDSTYTDYSILALVEYGNLESGRFIIQESVNDSGKLNSASVRITMNVDYLNSTHSLWDGTNNVALMNYGADRLFIGDQEYDITQLTYDGPLEAKPILCIIYADPKPNVA
ncbi:MAG: hypothetical protein H6550_15880 [Chitinophagales bacterium]|nr:hypothetical protein [Chitinophagales bacterium]